MGQIPTPAPGSVESLLWAVAALTVFAVAILTGLNQWRQFFKREEKPNRDEEMVTRADLDKNLKQSNEAHDRITKESTDKFKEIITRLEKAEKYATDNVHELRGVVQATNSTLALVQLEITKVLQVSINNLVDRLNKTESSIARLGNRVSGLIGETRGLKEEVEKRTLRIAEPEDEGGA